jgi:hypothetical protein
MTAKRGPGRPKKRGRPKKPPGAPVDHRLTPRVKAAIAAMVADNLSIREAAAAGGLSADRLHKAMKEPPAMSFYAAEVKALQTCAKHQAVHTLIAELKGDNAAARGAAARTLIADDARPQPPAGMAQTPGFVFMVVAARDAPARPPLPNGHAVPALIEATAEEADEIEAPE